MAKGQTLIWTALPNGRAGDDPTSAVRISAYLTPQLWNTDASVKVMKLSEFPDWLDFPAQVAAMTFDVDFDGLVLPATVQSPSPLRSDLWKALFTGDTPVFPYRFEDDDVSKGKYLVLETSVLAEAIAKAYAEAAGDPALGAGADLPKVTDLAQTPAITGIARPSRPEPPFEPPSRPRDPVPAPEMPVPVDERPGCLGWLIRILCWLAKHIRWLRPLLGDRCAAADEAAIRPDYQVDPFEPTSQGPVNPVMPTVSVPGGPLSPPPPAAALPTAGMFTPSTAEKAAFEATDQYFSTKAVAFGPLPSQAELAKQHDFHQIVSLLGDYPTLLRSLGLVVDLTVAHDAAIPTAATAKVKVLSTWTATTASSVVVSPRTHYEIAAGVFRARPRADATVDIRNGFLNLADGSRNPVTQIDVAGSSVKYRNAATNVVVSADQKQRPPLQPENDGLPALQTEGIAVTQKAVVAQFQAAALYAKSLHNMVSAVEKQELGESDPPPEAAADGTETDELWADTVVRGYRVDVLDVKAKTWFSLHRRDALYEFAKLPGEKVVVADEEGFVEPSSTKQPDTPEEIRVHETLFSWQGWSLSVPRPHKAIVADDKPKKPPEPVVRHLESQSLYGLASWYRVVARSLPRLRYGREYRLRARVVDLAGNSVCSPGTAAFATTPAEATGPVTFGRFEPLGPPSLLPLAPVEEGESVERMVVRSDFDSPAADIAADPDERHVVPPRATQALVELHGMLDTADGVPTLGGDATTKDLASREAGSLTHGLDLATNQHVVLPGAEEVVVTDSANKQTGQYWIQKSAQFPLAYLPDPIGQGAQFLSLPGETLGVVSQPGARPTTRVPFDGPFPDFEAFRLRIVGIPAGQAPAKPRWLPATEGTAAPRVLVVEVPQGQTHAVRYSSFMSPESAERMGAGQWVEKLQPSHLSLFRNNVAAGRHWMLMPYRTLVLVHAVRQPLAIPKIEGVTAKKLKPGHASAVGETSAILDGTLALHAGSTGKVQLHAAWTDPFDDPSKPGFDEVADVTHFEADVGEVQIVSPGNDNPTFGLTHFIKDTKFHRITYAPVATTRYREYFDPKTPSHSLVRPTAKEVEADKSQLPSVPRPTEDAKKEVRIPNSARPAPPRIHSVVPTFRWDEGMTAGGGTVTTVTRTRVGGGLRVYLERPWFSTGWEEQLGVVFARPGQADNLAPELRQVLLSHLAADPIYAAADLPASQITSAKDFGVAADQVHDVTLAENGLTVSVVGFDARFDATRGLWYSDLEFAEPTTYFPFLRLALVRFQPTSVKGAHISAVVRAEYAQLLPSRTAVYTFDHDASGLVHVAVAVSGVGFPPSADRSKSAWAATIERRASPSSTELEWEPLHVMIPDAAGGDERFRATFDLDGFVADQFRVVVRELELFPVDDPRSIAFTSPEHAGSHGHRVVYADARMIG